MDKRGSYLEIRDRFHGLLLTFGLSFITALQVFDDCTQVQSDILFKLALVEKIHYKGLSTTATA